MSQDHTHKLVKNAKVEVTRVIDDKKNLCASITINDEFQHRFSPRSRVSKHLEMMTPADLGDRLSGGQYFIIDDQLIDFRDGSYNGFVHTDETINVFMDLLGVQDRKDMPLTRRRNVRNDDDGVGQSDLVLRKVWDKSEIIVPGYQTGGDFRSELSYVWNPFVKTVNSAFDLVRQVCSNGMIGLTSFLNTKVPLFNRWDEHLDIASRQIQNRVNSMIVTRIQQMRDERASVAECLLVASHAWNRVMVDGSTMSGEQRKRLDQLFAIANPRTHLAEVYHSSVYDNKDLAAQLPGHLTHLDVFNIATEIRSHSEETAKSSNHALDRFANQIMFDNDTDAVVGASAITAPRVSIFSDPEAAFFSRMS